MMNITLLINGEPRRMCVTVRERLRDVLRRHGYKGVKKGCDEGECGACTVLMDDRAVNSCLVLAVSAVGHAITTIEGIGTMDRPHPLQKAIVETGGVQCGYCTPGFILSSLALIRKKPHPSMAEIKRATDGNYCRCTGYVKKLESVVRATARTKGGAR